MNIFKRFRYVRVVSIDLDSRSYVRGWMHKKTGKLVITSYGALAEGETISIPLGTKVLYMRGGLSPVSEEYP